MFTGRYDVDLVCERALKVRRRLSRWFCGDVNKARSLKAKAKARPKLQGGVENHGHENAAHKIDVPNDTFMKLWDVQLAEKRVATNVWGWKTEQIYHCFSVACYSSDSKNVQDLRSLYLRTIFVIFCVLLSENKYDDDDELSYKRTVIIL